MPEARGPEEVNPEQDTDNSERDNIEHDRKYEGENHEDGRGSRVAPAQQRVYPLELAHKVSEHALDAARQAPEPIISHLDHFRRFR